MLKMLRHACVALALLICTVSGVFSAASCGNAVQNGWIQTPVSMCSEFHLGAVLSAEQSAVHDAILIGSVAGIVFIAYAFLRVVRPERVLGLAEWERSWRWRWVWAKRRPFRQDIFLPVFVAWRDR